MKRSTAAPPAATLHRRACKHGGKGAGGEGHDVKAEGKGSPGPALAIRSNRALTHELNEARGHCLHVIPASICPAGTALLWGHPPLDQCDQCN